MAQKKIIYDINGKVKESTGNYYDDSANSLVLKNVTFNTMSINLPDGMAFVSGSQISSSNATDLQVMSWDNSGKLWKSNSAIVDIVASNTIAPDGSDLFGSFADIKVKSLSNVNRGNSLPVANGGTGLNTSSYPAGESLLVGNGANPMQLLTASVSSNNPVLVSTPNGWSYITQSYDKGIEVQIFNVPGTYLWTPPLNTKKATIILQGAGGGGAAGANRTSSVAAFGGCGGAAGSYIKSEIINIAGPEYIVVGSGGAGGSYPATGGAGDAGSSGGSSSFGAFLIASGGVGGAGGKHNNNTQYSGRTGNGLFYNYYNNDIYNVTSIKKSALGSAGGIDAGINSEYCKTSNGTNISNNGASGAGLIFGNYISNYDGGNAAVISSNIIENISFNSSGPDYLKGGIFSIAAGPNYAPNTYIQTTPYNDNGYSMYDNNTTSTSYKFFTGVGPNLAATDEVTLEWVFKQDAISSAYATLIRCQNNYGTGDGILCGINTTTQTVFLSSYNGSVSYAGYTSTETVSLNTWNHIAAVKKNYVWKFYLNGKNISGNGVVHYNPLRLDQGFNIFGLPSGAYNMYCLVGYKKSFRITRKALYDGDFSVPTSDYVDKSFTNSGSLSNLNAGNAYTESIKNDVFSTFPPSDTDIAGNSQTNDIYLASGGGGGASAAVTEAFDSETIALGHFNLTDPLKDNSAHNNSIFSSSASGIKIISSSSLPANISGTFLDGFVSSSAWNNTAGTASSLYFSPGRDFGTSDFSVESWMYLRNIGNVAGANTVTSYLLNAGYHGSSIGAILGVTSSAGTPRVRLYANNGVTPAALVGSVSTNSFSLNTWNHFVLQKSGSALQAYVNGVLYVTTPVTPIVNGTFGYSLGDSTAVNHGTYNFNGYAKEFRVINRARSAAEILSYYNAVIANSSGSYTDPTPIQGSYAGGIGGNGAWGSGGGGGASTNYTGSLVGTRQGGNGGDGYVAVISYKY